jgi:hypothetical protein
VSTSARDGQVNNKDVRRIGKATACVRLTNFLFPPGLDQEFYVEFDLEDGRPAGAVTAVGTCKLVSNNVPEAGLVLAGCNLRVVSAPGAVGGIATSASVFNPFRLAGYDTGSMWTLLLYNDASSSVGKKEHSGHDDLEYVEDGRSDDEIRAAKDAMERRAKR